MAELNLWLIKSPSLPPVKITVDDDVSIFKLKDKLLAHFDVPAAYQIICLRTGKILSDEADPISFSTRDGDSFMVRQIPDTANTEIKNMAAAETTEIPDIRESIFPKKLASTFSITGIRPYSLNFFREYPVLAINIRYGTVGLARTRSGLREDRSTGFWFGEKTIYAKDTFFLIADQGEFRWISQSTSILFTPDSKGSQPEVEHKKSIRYSLNKDEKESRNMIYPVRAFSITGISMDGFDPAKAYPVLGIDMDQYIPENQQPEENVTREPQSQAMAFFLVGDNNGEFAWIAEDECRLFPLDG
jgi:hypothetical protein